jgi:HTH-type transcriptional regulator / antitoxin HigA
MERDEQAEEGESVMATVLANPAEMIEHGAPHVIHSEEELVGYTAELERLTSIASPSASEIDAIELLSFLIEKYEDEHYPVPVATPTQVVRFLLDQHNLKQRDIAGLFGGESQVSMFLSGQRKLTIPQIRALSERFHVTTDVFLRVA